MKTSMLSSCSVLKILLFFLLVAPCPANAQILQTNPENAAKEPMVIKSNTLEVDDELKMVTFTGDVNAKKGDLVIECNTMRVYYENRPGHKGSDGNGTKVDKIVATGDVRISRAQGGLATAEKAVYYQADEKVILTGKPVVKQGDDFVEGEKVTIFLRENRSIVESARDQKVKAIIFPKHKGK